MLTDFRAAVFDYLNAPTALGPLAPVWDHMPDDPAEIPCIVVGRPLATPTATAVVFDMALELYVIGRRQQAGGNEAELTALADRVWLAFNGTRGTKHVGLNLAVRSVIPQEQQIAGNNYPAYLLSVESSIATC